LEISAGIGKEGKNLDRLLCSGPVHEAHEALSYLYVTVKLARFFAVKGQAKKPLLLEKGEKGKMGSGILCARLSWRIPVGLSPTQVKLSRQPATEAASVEVTKLMEPGDRRCWAATQVNVLSPEIDVIEEADSLE